MSNTIFFRIEQYDLNLARISAIDWRYSKKDPAQPYESEPIIRIYYPDGLVIDIPDTDQNRGRLFAAMQQYRPMA